MIRQFPIALRVIHWLMALMVIAMLFIGVMMISTVTSWHLTLYAWHKPLGIAILSLVVVRALVNAEASTLIRQLPQTVSALRMIRC